MTLKSNVASLSSLMVVCNPCWPLSNGVQSGLSETISGRSTTPVKATSIVWGPIIFSLVSVVTLPLASVICAISRTTPLTVILKSTLLSNGGCSVKPFKSWYEISYTPSAFGANSWSLTYSTAPSGNVEICKNKCSELSILSSSDIRLIWLDKSIRWSSFASIRVTLSTPSSASGLTLIMIIFSAESANWCPSTKLLFSLLCAWMVNLISPLKLSTGLTSTDAIWLTVTLYTPEPGEVSVNNWPPISKVHLSWYSTGTVMK